MAAGTSEARDLDLRGALVAPEPRQFPVLARALADEHTGEVPGLVGRVLHRFEPDPPARSAPPTGGGDPDAHHDDVRGQHTTVGGHHRGHPSALVAEGRDARAEIDFNAASASPISSVRD